jgi:hypothetical protein
MRKVLEYLGHLISGMRVQPAENKVTAIQDALEPTNLTEYLK